MQLYSLDHPWTVSGPCLDQRGWTGGLPAWAFQWKVGCIKEKCLYLGWVGLDQNKVVLRLYVLTYLVQRYMRGCVSDKQLRSLSDFERACLSFLLAQAHLNFFSLDRVWTISIL